MSKPIAWRIYACTRAELIGKVVQANTKSEARAAFKRECGKLPPHTGIERVKG